LYIERNIAVTDLYNTAYYSILLWDTFDCQARAVATHYWIWIG